MADLSSLTTEQLEAYKSLLFRKISANQASQGLPPAPKVEPPGDLNPKNIAAENDPLAFYKHPSLHNFIPPELRRDIPQGIESIANKDYANGITDLSQGVKKLLTPAAVPLAVADPLALLPATALSLGTQKAGELAAKGMGANPDQVRATGEVTSWVPFASLTPSPLRGAIREGTKEGLRELGGVIKHPIRSAGDYELGNILGGHNLGIATGLGIPFIRGAVRGSREGFSKELSNLKVEPLEGKFSSEEKELADFLSSLKNKKEGKSEVNSEVNKIQNLEKESGVKPEEEPEEKVEPKSEPKTEIKLEVKNPNEPLYQGLNAINEQNKLDRPFSERKPNESSRFPEGSPEAERAQSTAREAKENRLAQYFIKNNIDVNKLKPTSDLLKSLGKEAGLSYKPSLRTFENAVEKARKMAKRMGIDLNEAAKESLNKTGDLDSPSENR